MGMNNSHGPPTSLEDVERRKLIANPILDILHNECNDAADAMSVLLMVITEVTARSIQSSDPNLIGHRLSEIFGRWTGSLIKKPPAEATMQ
jgi:hypothetical protein